MNSALDVSARQELQRIARVHCQRRVLGLHPLPLVRRMIANLQACDGLAEEEREAAEIGVTIGPRLELGRFLRRVLAVFHVAEVVLGGIVSVILVTSIMMNRTYLAFHLIPVNVREVVLGEFESNGEEDKEGIQDFTVKRLYTTW